MSRRSLLAAAAALALLSGSAGLSGTAGAAAQPDGWNLDLADVPAAQALGHGGSGVTVAVVDSWVDATHPELGGRVLPGADCASGTCTAGAAPADSCGHGMHVAGVVASTDYGVAPDATILPVRVLTATANGGPCSATVTAAAAGVTWAAGHGAQVINLSVGGSDATVTGDLSPLVAAVHAAAAQGIVVVVAAGNDGGTAADPYGGDALTVAAVGRSGALASYSEHDGGVDVAGAGGDSNGAGCPGHDDVCVLSTWLDHDLAYAQGTSEAAPQVAGLAALLIAQAPSRGSADTVAAIETTAKPLAGAGHGLIDATAALRLRASTTTTTTTARVAAVTGCPKSVTVAPRARAVLRCRSTLSGGGRKVTLGVPQGKGYRTLATFKTAPDGSVRLLSGAITKTTKLRIGIGSTAQYVTVLVRHAGRR